MAARSRKPRARKPAGAAAPAPAKPAAAPIGGLPAALLEAGLQVGRKLLLSREAARMRLDAGRTLRELRELAGLTLDELAAALDLRDRTLLEAVEAGTATLSFELILRLSALLARNDPIPFVAQMARGSNPALWRALEDWGVGRIPLQLERERRFLNVFRGHDVARELSDEGFERVLAFLRTAFELALAFVAEQEGLAGRPRRRRKASRRADRR